MFPKSLILLIAAISVLAEERCLNDFSIGYLYKELGCKPVFEEASRCPTHFDCSEYGKARTATNACIYKGEVYQKGSEIPSEKSSPCVASCRCVEERSTGSGTFACANVECFDDYLENDNCTRLYSEDACCSVKTHCKGDGELPTCLVDGHVYVEGQKFYPRDEPCKECICKGGFEGKFVEPFCRDVSCDVELHYAPRLNRGCVPIYYGTHGCCPIDWRCPSSKIDKVIPTRVKAPKTTEAKCKFGDLEFEQYEELNTESDSIECKCMVPPYLTCINNPPSHN